MGNQQQQGTVHIRTDKGCYYAGETVTGTIYLWLPTNFNGNTLVLKVKGKEQTDFVVEVPDHSHPHHGQHGQHGHGHDHHHGHHGHNPHDPHNHHHGGAPHHPHKRRRYHHGKNIFYNHRIPVYQWGGSIPAGQYSFPFAFALHNYLPGTFWLDQTDFKGIIRYKVKAELESWNKKDRSVKNSCPLVIREPIKSAIGALHGEMRTNLSTWCCMNKGSSYIRCYFERNAYAPGEIANIIAEIDNSQCDLAIKNLRCSLKSKVSLRDNTGEVHEKTENVLVQDFEGVGARQSAIGEGRRCYSISLVNNQTKTPFQPSTNGQLIRCLFTLEVRADMEGCTCCSADPHVEVPVTIFAPSQTFEVIAPPPDWHPQAMPTMNIVLNDNYSYPTKDAAQMAANMGNININLGGGMAGASGMGGGMAPGPGFGAPPPMGGGMNVAVGGGPGGMASVQVNLGGQGQNGAYVNMDAANMNYAPPPGNH